MRPARPASIRAAVAKRSGGFGGERRVEPSGDEMHGKRLDAQTHGRGMARCHGDLGHRHPEVARAVAHAGQAHTHADAGHARGGQAAQLGEAVGHHQRAVGRRALEQLGRLGRTLHDDRAAAGLGHRARETVLGLAGHLLADALLTQRAQDGGQPVGFVGVGDLDVRPGRAPGGGEGARAVAHDVEVCQPQR
jgi:hypothetical protein